MPRAPFFKHEQQNLLRQLNGMKILVKGIERAINVNITGDLKSLDQSMHRVTSGKYGPKQFQM